MSPNLWPLQFKKNIPLGPLCASHTLNGVGPLDSESSLDNTSLWASRSSLPSQMALEHVLMLSGFNESLRFGTDKESWGYSKARGFFFKAMFTVSWNPHSLTSALSWHHLALTVLQNSLPCHQRPDFHGLLWWLSIHLCNVYKNHLPASVTLWRSGRTSWTVSPLWVHANPSFTSVYVTRVNNLIFQFSLWYKRYDKADIRTGWLRVCWRKRRQFASFSQLGGLQFWGLLARVLERLASHAQQFVSCLE